MGYTDANEHFDFGFYDSLSFFFCQEEGFGDRPQPTRWWITCRTNRSSHLLQNWWLPPHCGCTVFHYVKWKSDLIILSVLYCFKEFQTVKNCMDFSTICVRVGRGLLGVFFLLLIWARWNEKIVSLQTMGQVPREAQGLCESDCIIFPPWQDTIR